MNLLSIIKKKAKAEYGLTCEYSLAGLSCSISLVGNSPKELAESLCRCIANKEFFLVNGKLFCNKHQREIALVVK